MPISFHVWMLFDLNLASSSATVAATKQVFQLIVPYQHPLRRQVKNITSRKGRVSNTDGKQVFPFLSLSCCPKDDRNNKCCEIPNTHVHVVRLDAKYV